MRTANELAIRAQNGCAAAFAVLVDRYRPRLIRFVDQRVARYRGADAEDITQEVLAKAWQTLHRFRPQYQFATWLYTIATRTTTDHLRRPTRDLVHPRLESLPDSKLSHEKCLEISENVDNIWAIAYRVLKEDRYAVLWLRYGEDLTVKDIAQVLGKTSVGVRVLLHRARATLQPYLAADFSEGLPPEDRTEGT